MDSAPRTRRRRAAASAVERLESRVLFSTGELIRNGSFEGVVASADWTSGGSVHADSQFTNPHSGLGYAYLANADGSSGNSINGSIYQQLTIPANATPGALNLSFWTRISTSETSTTAQNDLLTVKVMDSTGASVLQNVATLSNLNASSSYVRRSYGLSNSLIGQTVRILISASTNATLATTFRVDDVGLATRPADLSKRVVGYLPNYESTFFPRLDYSLVTHVNYFSVSVNADGSLSTGGVSDTRLGGVVTAAHAKGAGVSITVGPQSFATVAGSATARAAFASNIKAYIQARNLDGVDIDWEPPATGANQANYALLIDELYKQLSPSGLKITAAVNPWTKEIPVAATNEMDWVNVMCYDFDYANVSSYAAATDGMNQWATYGVAKDKLVMGTPFYGRYGTSWSDSHSQTYGKILANIKGPLPGGAYPAPNVDSYVYPDSLGDHTVYFNGVTTIQKKMAYVRDNGFGGAMIWELGQDHWDDNNKYDQYSLLPVINSMLRPPSWLTASSGSMFDFVGGTFYASAGNVSFSGNAWGSNPNLGLNIASGANVSFTSPQRLSSLAIATGGTLNLTDESLVLDYSGASSPIGSMSGATYTGLTGMIASGRIMSTSAVANMNAIGVGEASQVLGLSGTQTKLFGGQTADASSILVKFTYAGDANLDGKVSISDYGRIDYNVGLGTSGWYNGDFNYDGKIDISDYGEIDFTIGTQGAALASLAAPTSFEVFSTLAATTPTPQAPTITYTKVGTTGLKLSWNSPTGGSAISKYRITWTPGTNGASKSMDVVSTARSASLANLSPFTLYSINVAAIDASGKSATTHVTAWTAAPSTQQRYVYVFDLPKNKQGLTNLKPQIEVFDVNNGHKWVKNIPLPSGIYAMRGLAASTATGKVYFTFYNTPNDTYQTGGLVCLDMVTNKILWTRKYTKDQVPSPDRFDITPDGKTIYMPVGENGPDNFWRIIDAATGNPLGKINFVTAPHNTIVSVDGKRVFLEGQEKGTQPSEWNHRIGVVDVATNKLIKTIGPFRDTVRPFTVNGKGTLVFATVNNFVGFQVGDVNTGKIKYTVAPPNYVQPNPPLGAVLSHGIAMTPDEKYLFVVDGLKIGVHVWDISKIATSAPKYLGFVKTRASGKNLAGQKDSAASNDAAGVPAWLAVSYDGKYVYAESGEIIDVATRKVVGQLRPKQKNSAGQWVDAPYTHSRFMIEVDFDGGKVVHTTDQFGVGLVR